MKGKTIFHRRKSPHEKATKLMSEKSRGKPPGSLTRRKHVGKALRESEAYYRMIFDNANDAIFIRDLHGRFLEVNQVACDRYGYSRDEFLQMSTRNINSPETEALTAQRTKELLKKSHEIVESTHVRRDGKIIPVEMSRRLITFRGKQAILSIARDITERTRMEKALQESEEKYRAIVENSPNMIGIFQDGVLKYINNVAILRLGWTYEELISPSFDPIENVVSQKSKSLLKENVGKRLRGEDVAPYEITLTRKDDSEVPVLVRGTKIIYNQKPAIEFVFDDITERKTAEQMLRLRSEIVETILEGLLLIRASDGMIVYANPQIEKMFGYDSGELIGKNITTTNAPTNGQSPEDVAKEIEEHLRRLGRWSGEVLNKKKDGTPFWCRSNLSTLKSSEYGTIWISVKEDITERKLAENTLTRSEKRFREAMEATNDGLWDWNVETGETYNSPAYYRMLGYEPGDFSNNIQFWLDHIHPEDRTQAVKVNQDCIENRASNFEVEFRMRTKSGGWKWILGRGRTSARDANGRALRMIGTHQDITERRRADEKLRQSVERYQSLFGRMLDGMYRSTHEGRFVDVNTAFVKMFGFTSKQEMLDITDIKKELYFSPEERGSHLLDTGQEEVEAYRMRRKDGSEIWVEDHGHYVHDKQGNIIYHEGILRDITERRLIEQRLRFRGEIVENISEGVAGIRVSDGVIVYTNPRFEEMLGYGLGELIGKNIATVNAPVNGKRPAEIAAGIIRRLGESRRWSGEIQNIKKDGTPIWCRASVSTLESSEYGRIWVATHEDITQRKQMEETLSRRAEELQALQATVLDITRQQDLPTLLNAIVERAAGLFGAPSGGMYLCDPDRQEVRCVISYNTRIDTVGTVLKYGEGAAGTVAQNGKPLIIEDYRTWTGRAAAYEKDQPFSAVLSAPMIWQSQVIGVIHVLDDNEARHFTESDLRLLELFAIHAAIAIENDRHSENLERMVAERTSKLADSQHQLQLMADSLPALISYIDPQQRYRFNNKAYEEWFGQSPNEILGRPVREVLGDNGYERTHGRMEAALLGARQSFEYELTSKSGTRQISATYIPDFGEQEQVKGVFVLGIDITERKKMEERLLKAERLAAIGETAAMVGHDLRNPLQAISVAAYVLEKRLGPEADMQTREMLESVKNSVSYSDRIVEDLLEYSEETRLELSETTPKTIALEALLNVRIPDNISVSNLTSDEPKIRIDPVKIRRLFLNLIENAVDSMPDGGKLTIISNKSNNYVELKFIDTGVGVSEHVLRELWKPFITTKPKGMGLGLAICKRITEAHGGSISLDTRKGEGTTFTVRLPLTANHEGDKNA